MSKAEKFISEHTRNCSNLMQVPTLDDKGNIVPEAHPWLTPDQARKTVEIAREEVVERACEYLDGLIELLNDKGHGLKKEHIIGGLKQAMRNE